MPDKKYSVVKVIDPASANHLVRLNPKQSIYLQLSKSLGIAELQIDGHHLKVSSLWTVINKGEKSTVYEISQTSDLNDWSKVSTAHLGNVTLLPLKGNPTRMLSVVLDSNNRAILTVVNPSRKTNIKLDMNQIVEVVLSNVGTDGKDWDFISTEGDSVLRYDLVFKSVVYSTDDTSQHKDELMRKYAIFRSLNKDTPETHFWFHLDKMSRMFTDELSDGVHHGGTITFNSGELSRSIDIQLRIKNKGKKEKEDHTPVIVSPKSYTTYHYNSKKEKESEPNTRTVTLKEKVVTGIDTNCHVIYKDAL